MAKRSMAYDIDDVVVWPDGTWATLSEVRAGDYSHMSDDYEIVERDNECRLCDLGIGHRWGRRMTNQGKGCARAWPLSPAASSTPARSRLARPRRAARRYALPGPRPGRP